MTGEFEKLNVIKERYAWELNNFIEHQDYFDDHDTFISYYKCINKIADQLKELVLSMIHTTEDSKRYLLAYLICLCDNTWDSYCRKPHEGGGYEFHSVAWCVCLARKLVDLLDAQDLETGTFSIIDPSFPINTIMNLYADWMMIKSHDAMIDIDKYFSIEGMNLNLISDKEYIFMKHMPESFIKANGTDWLHSITEYMDLDKFITRRKKIWDLKDF